MDYSECRSMCIGLEVLYLSLRGSVNPFNASVILVFICFPLNLFECSRSSAVANTMFSRMSSSVKRLFLRRVLTHVFCYHV